MVTSTAEEPAPLTHRSTSRRTLMSMAAGGLATIAGGVLVPARGNQAGAQSYHQATPAAADGELAVRRNGKDLSAAERETFVNSVLALKKKPSPWIPGVSVYDTFVLWHRDAFGCAVMAAHMGPAFLPWHRQFLIMFEQELQAIEPSVTLPYWDWSVDNTDDAYRYFVASKRGRSAVREQDRLGLRGAVANGVVDADRGSGGGGRAAWTTARGWDRGSPAPAPWRRVRVEQGAAAVNKVPLCLGR